MGSLSEDRRLHFCTGGNDTEHPGEGKYHIESLALYFGILQQGLDLREKARIASTDEGLPKALDL
jgi:hypothetical protein